MGILNVTPDSFADGGLWTEASRAVDAALQMEADGADLIDVGGESTRPGAEALPLDVELARVMPVIEALASRLRVPISVDTYKAEVPGTSSHIIDSSIPGFEDDGSPGAAGAESP